jgi:hypothetical protein
MANMTNILRVLDASAQAYEVVLLERHGPVLLLKSPSPVAPDTALQLRLEGELLLGEATASIPRNGHFEVWMRAQEVLADSWHPHSDWSALDTEESVLGSLRALNSHLVFYEERRRTHRNGRQHNLNESR